MTQPLWMAGAARADIAPVGPVHLAGAVGVHRPAEAVLEPLFARALVLQAGDRRACLIVLDVTIVTADCSAPLRQVAADIVGCTPQEVIVCATQTHSAPSLGHLMLDPDFPALPPDCQWLRGGDSHDSAAGCEDRRGDETGAGPGSGFPAAAGARGCRSCSRRRWTSAWGVV